MMSVHSPAPTFRFFALLFFVAFVSASIWNFYYLFHVQKPLEKILNQAQTHPISKKKLFSLLKKAHIFSGFDTSFDTNQVNSSLKKEDFSKKNIRKFMIGKNDFKKFNSKNMSLESYLRQTKNNKKLAIVFKKQFIRLTRNEKLICKQNPLCFYLMKKNEPSSNFLLLEAEERIITGKPINNAMIVYFSQKPSSFISVEKFIPERISKLKNPGFISICQNIAMRNRVAIKNMNVFSGYFLFVALIFSVAWFVSRKKRKKFLLTSEEVNE